MAYMGTDDPDGWVICNGAQRTNGSDGKYNNLIAASIGSWTANTANYTPPDYRGAFLRGTGTNGTDTTYSGGSVGTKQLHATQKHTHSVTDNGHKHTLIVGWDGAINDRVTTFFQTRTYNRGQYTSPGYPNPESSISMENAYSNITVNASTNSDNFISNDNETRPYNYGVNWIIKL
jgi:hypothetical protein